MELAPEKNSSDDRANQRGSQKPDTGFQIGPYGDCVYHKSGLFSTIYKSQPSGCTYLFAIKETTPSTEQTPHNSEREARLLRRAAHRNVVELLEVNRLANGRFLMTFPFLPITLEDLLISESSLVTKSLMVQLFRGLAHLHCEWPLAHILSLTAYSSDRQHGFGPPKALLDALKCEKNKSRLEPLISI